MELVIDLNVLLTAAMIVTALIVWLIVTVAMMTKQKAELEDKLADFKAQEEVEYMAAMLGMEGKHKEIIPVLEAIIEVLIREPRLNANHLRSVVNRLRMEL